MIINVNETRNIYRGDIVVYEDSVCMVSESLFTPEIYLVKLSNGLLIGRFDSIEELRESSGVTLLAKNSDVELIRKREA